MRRKTEFGAVPAATAAASAETAEVTSGAAGSSLERATATAGGGRSGRDGGGGEGGVAAAASLGFPAVAGVGEERDAAAEASSIATSRAVAATPDEGAPLGVALVTTDLAALRAGT